MLRDKFVLTIYGDDNVGKTTTIIELFKSIISAFIDNIEIVESYSYYTGRQDGVYKQDELLKLLKSTRIGEGGKPLDILYIIYLSNGGIIGIRSMGDPSKNLKGGLEFLIEKKCNIIICAHREHLMGSGTVLSQNGYSIYKEEKIKFDEHEKEEKNKQFIEDILKKYLDGWINKLIEN